VTIPDLPRRFLLNERPDRSFTLRELLCLDDRPMVEETSAQWLWYVRCFHETENFKLYRLQEAPGRKVIDHHINNMVSGAARS
jgi:hypothetical protein